MSENLLFLAVMLLISLAFFWLMLRFPNGSRKLVLFLSLAFVLLFELNSFACYAPLSSPLHALMSLLCLLLTVLLLLAVLVRPLRRRLSPWTRRWLLLSIFTLFPLQLAFSSDAFTPIYLVPLGMEFSTAVACLVGVLLLWNTSVAALARYLERYGWRATQSRPSAWGKRGCWLLLLLLLAALLSPLVFRDTRESRPLPDAAAQHELEEMESLLQEYMTVSSQSAYRATRELIREFARTGDESLRSEGWDWSMLHLACIYRKPALAAYLLAQGANPNETAQSALNARRMEPLALLIDSARHARPGTEMERCGEMVKLLLEAGGNLETPWHEHRPERTLRHVLLEDCMELAAWLREHGVTLESLPPAR